MTKTAVHPSTGETLTYNGTRDMVWATFARGGRNFALVKGRKVWTITRPAEGDWEHVGWSSADTYAKALSAAKGTTANYRVEYHAVRVEL